MDMPISRTVNLETGEVEDKEFTEAELALYAQIESQEQEAVAAKAAAKQAVLDKLGLTEEELRAALA